MLGAAEKAWTSAEHCCVKRSVSISVSIWGIKMTNSTLLLFLGWRVMKKSWASTLDGRATYADIVGALGVGFNTEHQN